ncbi:MAG: carbohydrate binding domain-containing protein [Sedimentisphaerales bacterium]|nr:carbohydrate binding domain-containing protein [Sedimentisphaerales bacterium]
MSKKLFLIALISVLSVPVSLAQENQIVNGEFDDGLNSWGLYGAVGFNVEVVQDGALSGNNAVLLDITDAASAVSIGIAQGGFQLVQDQTYPFGFMARSDQEREMVVLIQLYKPEGPSWTDIFLQRVLLTTEPRMYFLEYTHQDEDTIEHPGWSADMYLMLKGQWWSMNGSDLNTKVWIDWVFFGAEPEVQDRSRAVDPIPADGSILEDTWVSLQWVPGDFAVSHNVYMGENFDDVNDGVEGTLIGSPHTPNLVVGFPGFAYPDGLVPGTTYYWRVDEVNDAEPNSPWKGPVWSFMVPPYNAYNPSPPDMSKFVDQDVTLRWGTGFGSKLHTIYFSENFDDVNDAVMGLPQAGINYTPGTLEFGKTYYWRVDEFGGANTYKGDLWSFTVTKEGGGLKAEYFNNTNLSGQPVLTRIDPRVDFNWGNADVPGENSPGPAVNVNNFSARWSGELEVDLTDTYTFHVTANNGYRLWLDGELIIDYWDNPTTDTTESEPIELVAGSLHSIQMEYFEGADTAIAQLFWENSTRSRHIIPAGALQPPLRAGSPNPSNHAVDISQTRILSWSAVENAVSHQVYFGTDEDAVTNADTTSPEYKGSKNLGSETYDPGQLLWAATYYWRIDEVKTDGSVQTGHVWSFSTANFLIVDDMESYNDLDPSDPASNRIFNAWIDGFDNPTNGSLVGYDNPPFTEQTIVHSGNQSMPFAYDNAVGKSEATLTLTSVRNWTENGINTLTIWFMGQTDNAAEQMYVVLNNSAVVSHGNPDAAQMDQWTRWNIDLQAFADQDVNLSNVNTLTIGFGNRNNPVAGGAGMVFFDDIRLYLLVP